MRTTFRAGTTLVLLASAMGTPAGAQILETETARPLGRHVWELSGNFEYQLSSEGRESAVPFAVEYGLTDRLELLAEPVAWTAISPKAGAHATGVGDLEVTMTWLARAETARTPAFALAGELKIPTAHDSLIGTGKTDAAVYLIGSRRRGRLDTHANLSYTMVGRPAGATLKNIFGFALGAEFAVGRSGSNELFGEVLGNTAAASNPEPGTGSGGGTETTATPEAPAGEVSATVGAAHYFVNGLRASLGLSVDNNGAVLFRPGVTMRFR
jgi:hypothetical protein